MTTEKAKRDLPLHKKWLLENYEQYLQNKKLLTTKLPETIFVQIKNSIIVYENVARLVKEIEQQGIKMTIN